MGRKKKERPEVSVALSHAADKLGGELRYSCDMNYVVVEIAPGELASVIERETGFSVHWPWGAIGRRRFDCPDLTHVRHVLDDLLVTEAP